MAGGIHAAVVLCPACAGRSVRTSEGLETDMYCCESCNGEYGIDWSSNPPDKPCWPPSPEELELVKFLIARKREQQARSTGRVNQ